MMKRSVLAALVAMPILVVYLNPVSAADTIRIAYSSVNPHALLVSLAEKRGLFAKYGLSSVVVYIPGGSTVVQTMVSGDIDLGQLTGAPGVAANLGGAEIRQHRRFGFQRTVRERGKEIQFQHPRRRRRARHSLLQHGHVW